MGLDMYLYRVTTPYYGSVRPCAHVSYAEYERLRSTHKNIRFLAPDELCCNTIRNKAIRCFVTEKYYNFDKMLYDGLMKLGFKIPSGVNWVEENIRMGGSSHSGNVSSYRYYACDENSPLTDFLAENSKTNKPVSAIEMLALDCNRFLNDDTWKSVTLVNKDGYIVKVSVMGKTELAVTIRMPDAPVTKRLPYIRSKEHVKYVINMENVDYQRKGLNDEGWELLPDNCAFCDDKQRIKSLVERGGLSQDFLDEWVDGESVFMAWW